ncbi:FxSxx-COOH cyclophane-containing RiPP peptide [Streptomyces sp. TRM64462]|uniref:FxSxx-COOH cyclophane-containing RiPP peptide n=1 Tax=Streptomyces sp. TRM64462 TaxID=2741726 RepID=UPI0015860AEE|nr:FxSxx-COOH cyclophane-containing RiPP peptide [Streptomyces sp. TRM64462]
MSAQTSVTFAAKKNRVPLAELDARGADAAKRLSRVLPAESAAREQRSATFNSAL